MKAIICTLRSEDCKMKFLKWFFVSFAFVSTCYAQTPHITAPYFYLFDYPTENTNGAAGITQVNHFELQIDAGPLIMTSVPSSITSSPSPTPCVIGGISKPCSTYKIPSSAAMSLPSIGAHTFIVRACIDATSGGCVASTPFAFVLDPLPLPSAQRLGVGL